MTRDQLGTVTRWAERTFVVLALLLMSDAIVQLAITRGGAVEIDRGDGFFEYQVAVSVVYLATGLLLLPRIRPLLELVRQSRILVLLVGLALLSTIWSVAPEITLRRGIALVGTTLLGFYIALRFTAQEFMRLLGVALLIAAAVGLILAVLVPEWGVHLSGPHEGWWRGAFHHKNIAGRMMSLGVLVFVLLHRTKEVPTVLGWVGIGLCGFMLLMAGSAGGWLITLLVLASYPVLKVLRTNAMLVIPGVLVVLLAAGLFGALVLFRPDEFFALVGRDASLTGRIPLWIVAAQFISERPFLGFGYRAFWFDEAGYAGVVWREIGWAPSDAHNSFVDLLLQLGLIGFTLFATIVVLQLVASYRCYRYRDEAVGTYSFVIMLYMLWASLAGTVAPTPNSVIWVALVAMVIYVADALRLRPAEDRNRGEDVQVPSGQFQSTHAP